MKSLLLVSLFLLASCSVISTGDKALIAAHSANATTINSKIQGKKFVEVLPDGSTQPADYINKWWKAEAQTWVWMKDWANGAQPKAAQP